MGEVWMFRRYAHFNCEKWYIIIILFLMSSNLYSSTRGFVLAEKGKCTTRLLVNENEALVVHTAITLFQKDVETVTGSSILTISDHASNIRGNLIVGTVGRNNAIGYLEEKGVLDLSEIRNKWEGFLLKKIVWKGAETLVIVGSDNRDTAYGILELSRIIGVSPWHYFADVLSEKQSSIILGRVDTVQIPSVQYRGVFINDEDWGFMPWATETCDSTSERGAIGPKVYEKVFELLLRLRANTLWPAMHECTIPFYLVEGNKEMADRYGIIIGTSHCEPMMRCALGEWDRKKNGAYNYPQNRERVLRFWKERLAELKNSENIYTIGMRGIHDDMMEGVRNIEEYKFYLNKVIEDQRRLLKNNIDENVGAIPQVFIPYKEVLDVYDYGLEVPEDVTLIWCDDNYGYIRRLSNKKEQERIGGSGVYYHVSYWGRPHDYLWLTSTSPGQIYSEMRRAYDYNARKIWILNVGDFKAAEYLSEFFLDLAWNINVVDESTVFQHMLGWNKKTFGQEVAGQITDIMKKYYHLGAIRKPEHMGWNRVEEGVYPGLTPVIDTEYNPFFREELSARLSEYVRLQKKAEFTASKIKENRKDAYFEMVLYPVSAAAQMNQKLLNAQLARYYNRCDTALSGIYAQLSLQAYHNIEKLTEHYNKGIAKGKWNKMMNMAPRNIPVFQAPVFNFYDSIKVVNNVDKNNADYWVWAVNAIKGVFDDTEVTVLPGVGHSFESIQMEENSVVRYSFFLDKIGKGFIKIATLPNHDINGEGLKIAVYVNGRYVDTVDYSVRGRSEKWKQNVLRNQVISAIEYEFKELGNVEISICSLTPNIVLDQIMVGIGDVPDFYEFPVR